MSTSVLENLLSIFSKPNTYFSTATHVQLLKTKYSSNTTQNKTAWNVFYPPPNIFSHSPPSSFYMTSFLIPCILPVFFLHILLRVSHLKYSLGFIHSFLLQALMFQDIYLKSSAVTEYPPILASPPPTSMNDQYAFFILVQNGMYVFHIFILSIPCWWSSQAHYSFLSFFISYIHHSLCIS